VAIQLAIYRDACGALSDEAWLAACRVALSTCEFFPMPVKLTEFAEAYAEDKTRQQIDRLEFQRIAESNAEVRLALGAGEMSADEAQARQETIKRRVADIASQLRAVNARSHRARPAWRHEDHAASDQRIAEGHWDSPKETTND
jgi:hypothetical protein